jgi:hypothetical protein
MIPRYHRVSLIAVALGCDRKTVGARARREHWPAKRVMNRWEYRVPADLQDVCREWQRLILPMHRERRLPVGFRDLNPGAQARAQRRLLCLLAFNRLRNSRKISVRAASSLVLQPLRGVRGCSPQSLWRWRNKLAHGGPDALVEQLRFNTGRPRTRPSGHPQTPQDDLGHLKTPAAGQSPKCNNVPAFCTGPAQPVLR